MRFRPIIYLTIITVVLVLSGCSGLSYIAETISWIDDGNGYLQYSTNDLALHTTINNYPIPTAVQDPYTGSTLQIIRKSGYLGAGQGAYFCYQDEDNYYRVLISGYGNCQIVKKVAGIYTLLQTWTAPANLLSGYDQINKIEIQRVGLGDFTILINNVASFTFTDTELTSGTIAFLASISSEDNESFPRNPNDARFQLTAPFAVP